MSADPPQSNNTCSFSGVSVSIDALGSMVSLCVDTSVYGPAAIFKTSYWYTDDHYVFIRKDTNEKNWHVELRLKSAISEKTELEALAGDFSNKLLDQQIRQIVISETKNVRDRLVEKAFFEGRKRNVL